MMMIMGVVLSLPRYYAPVAQRQLAGLAGLVCDRCPITHNRTRVPNINSSAGTRSHTWNPLLCPFHVIPIAKLIQARTQRSRFWHASLQKQKTRTNQKHTPVHSLHKTIRRRWALLQALHSTEQTPRRIRRTTKRSYRCLHSCICRRHCVLVEWNAAGHSIHSIRYVWRQDARCAFRSHVQHSPLMRSRRSSV